jgi:hypothetical protein
MHQVAVVVQAGQERMVGKLAPYQLKPMEHRLRFGLVVAAVALVDRSISSLRTKFGSLVDSADLIAFI